MLLMWDITNKCNLRCRHCYNAKFINDTGQEDLRVDDTELGHIAEFIRINEVTHLVITGGEPFAKPNLFDILASFPGGVAKCITTNATLVDEKRGTDIERSGLYKISVSLESASEEGYNLNRGKGKFSSFLRGLENISKACARAPRKIYTEFSVTVLPDLLKIPEDVNGIYLMAEKYGIDAIVFQFPISAGDNWNRMANFNYIFEIAQTIAKTSLLHESTVTFLQYKKILVDFCNRTLGSRLRGGKTTCKAGSSILYMDNTLNIYPCIYQNGGKDHKERLNRYLGDGNMCLRDKSGLAKDNGYLRRFNAVKEEILRTPYKLCANCPYKQECYKVCPNDVILNRDVSEKTSCGVCELIFKYENK